MAEFLSASELLQRYRTGDRDFRRCRLAGFDARGADLRQADFSSADLQGANFSDADLRAAAFVGADLSGANFQGALVTAADFTAANLQNVRGLDSAIAADSVGSIGNRTTIISGGQATVTGRGQPMDVPTGVAATATSLLPPHRSSLSGDREAQRSLTAQETQNLMRQLQVLRRWRGIATALALMFLFLAVLGGYLGYAKYRDYEDLEARVLEQGEERERQFEEISTELERLRQERQDLTQELADERERGADNALQVTALRQRLQAVEAQLETERERAEQLAEINQLLQERLKNRSSSRRSQAPDA